LVNFFPSPDLVKINPSILKNIGKKLIWVDSRIEQGEEDPILAELKKKTELIYGPGMFESVERDVKKTWKRTRCSSREKPHYLLLLVFYSSVLKRMDRGDNTSNIGWGKFDGTILT